MCGVDWSRARGKRTVLRSVHSGPGPGGGRGVGGIKTGSKFPSFALIVTKCWLVVLIVL